MNNRVATSNSSGNFQLVYDIQGRRVSEYNAGSSNAFVEADIYSDTNPVAFRTNGQTYYEHQNWLGTERLRTTYNGAVDSTFQSLPFGDGYTFTGSQKDQYDFAGLDRDSEDSTEHTGARNYATLMGRWLSPDPYYGSYDFNNPQSFNRYAYALNNPVSFADPSGLHYVGEGGGGGDCANDPNCGPGGLGGLGGEPGFSGYGGSSCAPDDASCGGMGDPFFGPCCGFLGQNDSYLQSNSSWYMGLVNGWYGLDPSETIYVYCNGPDLFDVTCMPGANSMQYFAAGTSPYYSNPIRALANQINGEAGWIGTPEGVAAFYGASLLGAAASYTAIDLAAGPEGSMLFGRGYYGWTGYLNGNAPWGSFLRVGYGWDGAQSIFRVGGTALEYFMENPHIDLWPW